MLFFFMKRVSVKSSIIFIIDSNAGNLKKESLPKLLYL